MPPFGKKPSFKYAFELSEEFVMAYENDEDTKIMVDLGRELEGNYRHASIHAAAVLVTPTKLTDYAAVQWDSDKQMKVCQYDWHDAEKIGILPCKMDILGVTIFSIIGNSIDLIKERRGVEIDLRRLDLWDEKVYKMLTNGLTFGVFQLSGGAMTKYLQQLKPTRIQDLQAMVALYRPGAMAQIPEFIRRRNNAKLVKYYVPQMVEWMEDTYGILVYQEDIMFTFMKLADYSFGQADNVRRALGKKNKQVLDKEFVGFLSGCENNQISKEKVQELWDLIVPFSDYSFNKAHSGAYGMVAYWTAYIKANFTAEYMASLMLAESGDAEKVALSVLECQKMNIQVLPPDINMSSNGFNIENDQTIRYGMKSIKNLSANTIEYLVTNRNKNGNYKDFEDFLDRICTQDGFNKRSLEALILSGSLDNLKT
jgi:DNA polymerase-3 subunit alpha